MVKAILSGQKTQTRRLIKPQPEAIPNTFPMPLEEFTGDLGKLSSKGLKQLHTTGAGAGLAFPDWYARPDDTLWVREKWAEAGHMVTDFLGKSEVIAYGTEEAYHYDGQTLGMKLDTKDWNWDMVKWKPSIHMAKYLCRLRLDVIDCRVERLNEISRQDAKREGIERIKTGGHPDTWTNYAGWTSFSNPATSFQSLWDSINGNDSWDENPWVWVVEFRVITDA